MVNQSVLSKNNPLGDVIYGVDNSFLSRALDGEIFAPYQSEAFDRVLPDLLTDESGYVTPVNYGDVCLNYDIAWFEENELDLPGSLEDLADPVYAGLLAVQNPATSSPGLSFLLTTIAAFGDEGESDYLNYWEALRENDVLVTDGWTDAYYGEFTVGSRGAGSRPLVVSYASSPPAEVLFSEVPSAGAVSGAIVADGMCFRQVEHAGGAGWREQRSRRARFHRLHVERALPSRSAAEYVRFPGGRGYRAAGGLRRARASRGSAGLCRSSAD